MKTLFASPEIPIPALPAVIATTPVLVIVGLLPGVTLIPGPATRLRMPVFVRVGFWAVPPTAIPSPPVRVRTPEDSNIGSVAVPVLIRPPPVTRVITPSLFSTGVWGLKGNVILIPAPARIDVRPVEEADSSVQAPFVEGSPPPRMVFWPVNMYVAEFAGEIIVSYS
jgi:hypothetical protein